MLDYIIKNGLSLTLSTKIKMTKAEMNQIVTMVLAGLTQQTENVLPFPTTSAKQKTADPVAELTPKTATRSLDPNNVEIVLTQSMIDNRIKLPRRMFGSKDLVKIDGNEIPQDESDNGRSLKFYPSIFGNVKVGQTLRFTFERQTKSARFYDVKIIGKGQNVPVVTEKVTDQPKSKKANTAAPKVAGKTKGTKKVDPVVETKKEFVADPLAKKIRACKSVKALIEVTGEIVIANESKGIVNDNIKSSATFLDSLGQDARIYLPTQQSQAFRATAKKLGLGLKAAIIKLNDEYNEYN